MLQTSNTKSAEPRKGIVGVNSGDRNRIEPVGKHKLDGSDNNESGHSGDSNGNLSNAPKLMCPPTPFLLMLRTSSSTASSSSTA